MKTIACPNCNKSLRLKDSSTLATAKCPACGAAISLAKKNHADEWHAKNEGEVYGPYTLEQLLAYIAEGRITRDYLVKHREHTRDRWENVTAVDALRGVLDQHQPRVAAPAAVAVSQVIQASMQTRMRPTEERSAWLFVVDFCDPTFKHYVTPTIIRITWCFLLVFTLAVVLVNLIIPAAVFASNRIPAGEPEVVDPVAPQNGQPFRLQQKRLDDPASTSWASEIAELATWAQVMVLLNILALLWCRVLLEVCIVVFDISTTLKRMSSP